ncbi:MAG: hypothetical protein R3330_14435, partial [Saprospiraceae bacterium]|nr:hypothetical protein [Saprospiraceae bacterium]
MRAASIQAARVLYGPCSFEEIQTTNAWHAVGVGDTFAPCTTPVIAFMEFNPDVVTETSSSTLCNAQSLITIGMYSAIASQTIHLVTAGNATPGVDFDLSSSSITFNGTELQYFDVVIYDDKVPESTPDTVIISFDDGGFSDTLELVILDDDVLPAVGGTVTLLTETFDVSTAPMDWSQELVNPGSANHWQYNGAATEAGRAYVAIPGTSNAIYDQTADAHVRLITPQLDARGMNHVTVSFDWEAGGETDAVDTTILYDFGSFQISLDGQEWTDIADFVGTSGGAVPKSGTYQAVHPELNNQTFYLGFRWYNDALVGSGFSMAIDNVVVMADGLPVATAVNSSMQAVVPAANPVAFVDADDNTMIAIVIGAQADLGCTEIHIDENNATQDTLQAPECDFRSAKVFEVNAPNEVDSFHITLYFKDDEIDDWSSPELLNVLAVSSTNIADDTS